MNKFTIRRLVSALCVAGIFAAPTQTIASGFQIWEQDVASIGNYHAGYAARANDASIAFYNPAGITRIKNQQIVFGGAEITSDFKYNGTIAVNTLNAGETVGVVAQGGASAFIPDLYYIAPLTDKLGFGFSVNVPFGSKVEYGRDTYIQYASVRAEVDVIDASPSLGYQVNDHFSVGAGFDVQKMEATFTQTGVLGPGTDTNSNTKGDDYGYGGHLGILYEFNPESRVGLSYHTQVVHHLHGMSKFVGPLADAFNGGPLISYNARTSIRIPGYAALSAYHKANSRFALMGSLIFTQWGSFKSLTLNNLAGISGFAPSTNIVVNVPEHFRNSWNAAIGADYFATDKITLRTGIGYDQTPTNNSYRNVQLPDNNRFAVALGGHYQATKAVGLDIGWSHLFVNNATIHPPAQATGDQIVSSEQIAKSGSTRGGADVFGAGVVWDIL